MAEYRPVPAALPAMDMRKELVRNSGKGKHPMKRSKKRGGRRKAVRY